MRRSTASWSQRMSAIRKVLLRRLQEYKGASRSRSAHTSQQCLNQLLGKPLLHSEVQRKLLDKERALRLNDPLLVRNLLPLKRLYHCARERLRLSRIFGYQGYGCACGARAEIYYGNYADKANSSSRVSNETVVEAVSRSSKMIDRFLYELQHFSLARENCVIHCGKKVINDEPALSLLPPCLTLRVQRAYEDTPLRTNAMMIRVAGRRVLCVEKRTQHGYGLAKVHVVQRILYVIANEYTGMILRDSSRTGIRRDESDREILELLGS